MCSGAYAHADGCYYPDLQDAMIGILGEKGVEAERLRDVMQRLVRLVGDRERALRDALNDHVSLDIQLFEARAAMKGSDDDDEGLDDPTGYCF